MKPSTFLTAGEASRATGKSIPTITRNVKNGKIANSRQGDDGEYEIDPTALFNRYPPIDPALGGKSNETPKMLGDETPQNNDMLDLIKSMTEDLKASHEALIEAKDLKIKELETEVTKNKNLLTDQRTEAERAQALADVERQKRVDIELTPKPKITRRKVGFFERLRIKEVVEVEEVA